MRHPTEKQISAMHDAWEQTTREWKLRKVRDAAYGPDELWVLENSPDISRYDPTKDYPNEIAAHKFTGKDAEQRARFLLRHKIVKAALTAALNC